MFLYLYYIQNLQPSFEKNILKSSQGLWKPSKFSGSSLQPFQSLYWDYICKGICFFLAFFTIQEAVAAGPQGNMIQDWLTIRLIYHYFHQPE